MKKLIIVILIGSLLVTSKVLAGPGINNVQLLRPPIRISFTKYPKEIRMLRRGKPVKIRDWKPCQLNSHKFNIKKNKRQQAKRKRKLKSARFVYN